jgi:ribose transport system substrate-binding protein
MLKRWMGAALAAVLLSACGGQSPGAPTAPVASAESAASASGKPVIAVIPKGLAQQFWLTVKQGADAAGAELNAEIIWQGPAKETEIAKQIGIIEDMISRKVDAIVMAACDENALVSTIQRAVDSGIPVITIDSGVKSELPLSFVATDNIAGAKAGAVELARLIGGEGPVAQIPIVPGAATSEMRQQGFEEGMAAYPGASIVATQFCNSDVAKAMDVTRDMLTANPELKGIFAACEAAAIGAAQALKTVGRAGEVKLVGFDAAKEQVDLLRDGTIHALVVQSPFQMGYQGVKAALDAINGKEVEKRIDTGVTVVTLENVDTPEVQKLLNPA